MRPQKEDMRNLFMLHIQKKMKRIQNQMRGVKVMEGTQKGKEAVRMRNLKGIRGQKKRKRRGR